MPVYVNRMKPKVQPIESIYVRGDIERLKVLGIERARQHVRIQVKHDGHTGALIDIHLTYENAKMLADALNEFVEQTQHIGGVY